MGHSVGNGLSGQKSAKGKCSRAHSQDFTELYRLETQQQVECDTVACFCLMVTVRGEADWHCHQHRVKRLLRWLQKTMSVTHAGSSTDPNNTWTLLSLHNCPFLSFLVWPADTLLIVVRHRDGKEWAFSCLCHSSARLTFDRHAVICRSVQLLLQQTITSSWWLLEGLIVEMSVCTHSQGPPYGLYYAPQAITDVDLWKRMLLFLDRNFQKTIFSADLLHSDFIVFMCFSHSVAAFRWESVFKLLDDPNRHKCIKITAVQQH